MPVARSIIWPLGDPVEEVPEYASVFACVCARLEGPYALSFSSNSQS